MLLLFLKIEIGGLFLLVLTDVSLSIPRSRSKSFLFCSNSFKRAPMPTSFRDPGSKSLMTPFQLYASLTCFNNGWWSAATLSVLCTGALCPETQLSVHWVVHEPIHPHSLDWEMLHSFLGCVSFYFSASGTAEILLKNLNLQSLSFGSWHSYLTGATIAILSAHGAGKDAPTEALLSRPSEGRGTSG